MRASTIVLSMLVSCAIGAANGYLVGAHKSIGEMAKLNALIVTTKADAEKHAKQLSDDMARIKNERSSIEGELVAIRDSIVSGNTGMYTHAVCDALPDAGTTVEQLAKRGTARLDDDVAISVLDFRRAYQQQLADLKECRAYVNAVNNLR